ncbi:putative peptidase [Acrocarpospora pleiomorpha]|uniref:Putative peptidase n=1 Tax=Acrocarpospora pleiomorpha TaxID=90975 RepID=A0A5M3XKI9_9ACTN|nr:M24 family metallopeptidase [Acrocarpospora pleiomorpha]GES19663.1 putative peptidase [Acrocarpospora pleiomorpha]
MTAIDTTTGNSGAGNQDPDGVQMRTGLSPKLGPAAAQIPMRPYPEHALPPGAHPNVVAPEHFPRLSAAERDRRWDGLRKRMIFGGVDCLILLGTDMYWDMGLANLRYVTGVGAKMGTKGLFFLDADPIVYNAVPHMSRPFHAQQTVQDWISDIRILRGPTEIAAELRDRGLDRARIGIVGFSSAILSASVFVDAELQALRAALPEARFVDFGYALEEMRMIKSEEELALMRQGGQVARKVIDAMVEGARPGVREAELYADMVRTQIANGAEPNIFNLMTSGPVEHPPTEIWHLLHGSDQPASPTMRPLAEGDNVISEFHTKYGGYLVHTEYTVHVGSRVPARLQRIWDVAVECLDISQDMMRPGVTVRELLEALRRPVAKARLEWVELGFHAMGLVSPEFPTVVYEPGFGIDTANGSKIGDLELEEGMAFGNNIDLFDPTWKPDVGCVLSDFMVVREGGAELLVGTPRTIGLGG